MTEGEEAVSSQQSGGKAATDLSHLLLHTTPGVHSGTSRGLGCTKGGAERGLISCQFRRFFSPWVTRDFFGPVLKIAGHFFDVGWTCNSPQQPAVDSRSTGGWTYNRPRFLDFAKFFYTVSCCKVVAGLMEKGL